MVTVPYMGCGQVGLAGFGSRRIGQELRWQLVAGTLRHYLTSNHSATRSTACSSRPVVWSASCSYLACGAPCLLRSAGGITTLVVGIPLAPGWFMCPFSADAQRLQNMRREMFLKQYFRCCNMTHMRRVLLWTLLCHSALLTVGSRELFAQRRHLRSPRRP